MLEKKQAVCKHCRTTFKYRGSTHLSVNLVRRHGDTSADDEDAGNEHARQQHRDLTLFPTTTRRGQR